MKVTQDYLRREIKKQKEEIARLRKAVRGDDRTRTSGVFTLEKLAIDERARADRILAVLREVSSLLEESLNTPFFEKREEWETWCRIFRARVEGTVFAARKATETQP
jgi:hypothetical protein